MVTLLTILGNCKTIFQNGCTVLHSHLTNICYFCLCFIIVNLVGEKWCIIVVLVCIFLFILIEVLLISAVLYFRCTA